MWLRHEHAGVLMKQKQSMRRVCKPQDTPTPKLLRLIDLQMPTEDGDFIFLVDWLSALWSFPITCSSDNLTRSEYLPFNNQFTCYLSNDNVAAFLCLAGFSPQTSAAQQQHTAYSFSHYYTFKASRLPPFPAGQLQYLKYNKYILAAKLGSTLLEGWEERDEEHCWRCGKWRWCCWWRQGKQIGFEA